MFLLEFWVKVSVLIFEVLLLMVLGLIWWVLGTMWVLCGYYVEG